MTAAYHHTGFFFNKESYDRIRSLLVFSSEFLHFRRTEFSTDAAETRIEFQLPHLKKLQAQTKICIFWNPAKLQAEPFSQTEFFSLVSAVSNPKRT